MLLSVSRLEVLNVQYASCKLCFQRNKLKSRWAKQHFCYPGSRTLKLKNKSYLVTEVVLFPQNYFASKNHIGITFQSMWVVAFLLDRLWLSTDNISYNHHCRHTTSMSFPRENLFPWWGLALSLQRPGLRSPLVKHVSSLLYTFLYLNTHYIDYTCPLHFACFISASTDVIFCTICEQSHCRVSSCCCNTLGSVKWQLPGKTLLKKKKKKS